MMKLVGTVEKDGKFWFINVPALNLGTQSEKKSEALEYIVDAISMLEPGLECDAQWISGNSFQLTTKDTGRLRGMVLKRARVSRGFTQQKLATLMEQKNHSTIAAYESGARSLSTESLLKYLDKLNYDVVFQVNPKTP